MEHIEANEEPNSTRPRTVEIELDRLDFINNELLAARRECAQAVANLQEYKAAVRATVIEHVKNGNICREGANEALESWGDEPYVPRFTVSMTVSLEITVDADDESAAYSEAYDRLVVTTDDDSAPDPYIYDHHFESALELPERPRG